MLWVRNLSLEVSNSSRLLWLFALFIASTLFPIPCPFVLPTLGSSYPFWSFFFVFFYHWLYMYRRQRLTPFSIDIKKNPLGQVDKKVLSTPALDHHTTTTHFKTSSQTRFLHHDKKVRQGETLLIAELDPNITDRLSLASSNKPSPSSDMDATPTPHTRISIVVPNGRIWKSSSDLEAFYDDGYAHRIGC